MLAAPMLKGVAGYDQENDMASELIADLPYRVVDGAGQEFYVSVAGEPRDDGRWDAWLEYVPLDDAPPLLTPTETTQPNRAAIVRWADTLSDIYVEGAFERAGATAADVLPVRRASRRVADNAAATRAAREDLPDPFGLFEAGPATMRARLGALPRSTLLDVIAAFDLNPAGKRLGWLSQHQLVTFIVTAVDAQTAARKRPR
jgi:hypothetical protein